MRSSRPALHCYQTSFPANSVPPWLLPHTLDWESAPHAGAVLAGFVLPTQGWQTLLYLVGILPLIFIALIWLIIPESPTFLAHKGHHDRARHALRRINPQIKVENVDLLGAEISGHSTRGMKQLLTVTFRRTTIALWVFAFFSLGTPMVIVQYLLMLLQQPSPGMDTAQSSTIFALYGFASVLSMLLLDSVLAKLPMYRTIAVTLTLAALTAILVSTTSGRLRHLTHHPDSGRILHSCGRRPDTQCADSRGLSS